MLKSIFLWLLCIAMVGVVFGRPSQGYRIVPRRAVMFSGYYSNPLFSRNYNYVPQGSMSAVVTRDAVATNTYSGSLPQYPPLDVLPAEENQTVERYTEKAAEAIPPQYIPPETEALPVELPAEIPTTPQPVQLEAEVPQEELLAPPAAPSEAPLISEIGLAEEVSTEAVVVTKAPKRVGKKKKIPSPPVKVDEEDEEDAEQELQPLWPFAGGKGGPSYNAFFPINISGLGPSSRTRSQNQGGQNPEDYYPGSATAIANSFSTGKGGIATSHATSFGDPYLASLVRNGLLNFRTKGNKEHAES